MVVKVPGRHRRFGGVGTAPHPCLYPCLESLTSTDSVLVTG